MKQHPNVNYVVQEGRDAQTDEVVVSLSHHQRPSLTKIGQSRPVVRLFEKRATYYTFGAKSGVEQLEAHIRRLGAKRAILIGVSKGAYGALLYGGMLAKIAPDLDVKVLSFSPQSLLFPLNENIGFPSYKRLIASRSDHPGTQLGLERYGDLSKIAFPANASGLVVYGAGNARDTVEASRLFGKPLKMLPLPFSFHGTLIPFTIDRNDREKVKARVEKLYIEAARNEDDGDALPPSMDELVGAICNSNWLPTLPGLIDLVFGGGAALEALVSEGRARCMGLDKASTS